MSLAVPKIRNSAKALIIENGAILLQRCQIGDQLVHLLPGGTQEFGESFADTVRREVLEEAGMRVRVGTLIWVREFIARNHNGVAGDGDHVVECIFRCTPEAGATITAPSAPDTAQIDVRWILLADLTSITMWPETVQQLLSNDLARANTLVPAYLGDCP
jgi:8-oxo-dGTP diphosphatase